MVRLVPPSAAALLGRLTHRRQRLLNRATATKSLQSLLMRSPLVRGSGAVRPIGFG